MGTLSDGNLYMMATLNMAGAHASERDAAEAAWARERSQMQSKAEVRDPHPTPYTQHPTPYTLHPTP